MKQIFVIGILITFLIGCKQNTLPKPQAYLSLNYPEPVYKATELDCPYTFEINEFAKLIPEKRCWNKIIYPTMKATVYLSYVPIKNNLDSLLHDAYQMPSKHIIKAEEIPEKVFQNPEKRVYGNLFRVVGEAASQVQFFLTDSIDHFIVGSLYFYTKPNYDSIMPAAHYIETDIIQLMDSFSWEDR